MSGRSFTVCVVVNVLPIGWLIAQRGMQSMYNQAINAFICFNITFGAFMALIHLVSHLFIFDFVSFSSP